MGSASMVDDAHLTEMLWQAVNLGALQIREIELVLPSVEVPVEPPRPVQTS